MRTLGIILAGGKSSRLFPASLGVTKQLLPIYDKPLIYYPLSTLMLAGIKDVLIITSPSELDIFKKLFKDHNLGIDLQFAVQEKANGIAEAFTIAMEHYGYSEIMNQFDRTCLILGDNIFYGAGFTGLLNIAASKQNATVFATKVKDPERFGVVSVEYDKNGFYKAVDIQEKPIQPKSNLAVTGLYFYPNSVYDIVFELKPSERGELEITDLNRKFLVSKKLDVIKMNRGMSWFDTGTFDSMLEASHFVQTIQKNQEVLIGSPHEVARANKWISDEDLFEFAKTCKNDYGNYLIDLIAYDIMERI